MKYWIQTASGIAFDLENPKPHMVIIEDIAHALSVSNRFNGHTRKPYSVAQHAVLVSSKCSPENKMWGLLHDATEAYVGDMVSPLKRMLPEFSKIERKVMDAICVKFDLPLEMPVEVHEVDYRMLVTEAKCLLGNPPRGWGIAHEVLGYNMVIEAGLHWESVKYQFLDVFEELGGKR